MPPLTPFRNPFTPGAGHPPPYLAGRDVESTEFRRLLGQEVILENMVLTGLRGVGKTVLLDTFKPEALRQGWRWVGADVSRSASISEDRLAVRLMADLSVLTSAIVVSEKERRAIGFHAPATRERTTLDFALLRSVYDATPGLVSDKLKTIVELVWKALKLTDPTLKGVVIAYDEAQNLGDQREKDEYPLSILLDVFQSVQKKRMPFLLVLAGLPTLFPTLVEARTFAERMFRVVTLDRLDPQASREAITRPIRDAQCQVKLDDESVDEIVQLSGGYPYFIQFICREAFDALLQQAGREGPAPLPVAAILQKLDSDFFEARWSRLTDRQRQLLWVIAHLPGAQEEFTAQQLLEMSERLLKKPFGASHANQVLAALARSGHVYKNRHGRYTLALPLLGQFILRQEVALEGA
ncbi:MAG: AAA family ATPase [Candidatus Sumerlaeia bacterium]|nr:AAA family ATPase [Candidatus Sumerlaeia bacterium]